jgi:peptide/nickel transport system permease protein
MSYLSALTARLGLSFAVIFGVATLVFFLIHLIPGDPVLVALGEYGSSADYAGMRSRLGLDRPLLAQWMAFLGGVARLDLGTSLASGAPVAGLLGDCFTMTLVLAGASLAIAIVTGIPLGIAAAVRRGGLWDRCSSAVAVAAMSLPNFVLGPLLILVFAVSLRWVPVSGAEDAGSLILPALTLGLSMSALLARMTRAALVEVLQEPFIVAARARGLAESRVVLRHALATASLPILTAIGLQLGALLGGAVVTEAVFDWPGLGQLLIDAIYRRDYPVVQGGVLLIASVYVLVNTLIDLMYLAIDPRIAQGRRAG